MNLLQAHSAYSGRARPFHASAHMQAACTRADEAKHRPMQSGALWKMYTRDKFDSQMDRFQFESRPVGLWLAAKIELILWNWRKMEGGGGEVRGGG